MQYKQVVKGRFHSRPNRFIANIYIEDKLETVHVKNTGRCRELLLPGADVILEVSDNPNRKTAYDLIAVYKDSVGLVNMDSQAPNKVVAEWLAGQGFDYVKPEYTYGKSRVDFYMEKGDEKFLMEVKGCTLEIDGMGYFPDAPTERGVRHLRELMGAKAAGFGAHVVFVVQMERAEYFTPNTKTHPAFAQALQEAAAAGVGVYAYTCRVTPDGMELAAPIPVVLEG